MRLRPRVLLVLVVAALFAVPAPTVADSVAQVQTAKRISRQTVILLDPQGRPGAVPGPTDSTVRVGDIVTFIIQFTPVPNGSTRGLGGYVTDYIPRNTEVVGARIVDRDGNTVAPHRGGLAANGVGPRGPGGYAAPLLEGSMSQLYADTGVFYSTDPRTARVPDGSVAGEEFVSLFNGIAMTPKPTAQGQLAPILGAPSPSFAHNQWDWGQILAFGTGSSVIGSGSGNTPHLYGSAVAGPDTWYPYEATWPTGAAPDLTNIDPFDSLGNSVVGPWKRIQTLGGEIGTDGGVPDPGAILPSKGIATRVGVLAVDGNGLPAGWALSPDTACGPNCGPLPSYVDDPGNPGNPLGPYTTAVRFAVGELVVGEEYFTEISLRVLDLPMDPITGLDMNCAEVTGGDSSVKKSNVTNPNGGKDHTWRYYLPAPSCVVLNNFFDLSVDRLTVLPNDSITYTVEGKNLSTQDQTGVFAYLCFDPASVTFVAASGGGTLSAGDAQCPSATPDAIVWDLGTLLPGDSYLFTADFTVANNPPEDIVITRAIYVSAELPSPGFQVVAATNVQAITVLEMAATATPDVIATPPGTVTYAITIDNVGTGDADAAGCTDNCRIEVTLPAGFTYAAGSSSIGDPVAPAASPLVFDEPNNGLTNVLAGGSYGFNFDADVPAGQAAGLYTIDIETWYGGAAGNDINDAWPGLAEVAIGAVRSDTPTIDGPIVEGATTVSGTSTEPAGTEVTVYVNGVPVGTATVDANGSWSATIPEVFAGQQVTATQRDDVAGELDSTPVDPPVTVAASGGGAPACSDGVDNDGDGLTDFPDDPGCVDASDIDETDIPECSDGIDNDGDGLTDYPADPKCASFQDDTETGLPECSDGVDNDGDGATDFPDDTGCADANGARESVLPACSDGLDNDGDGAIDYPFDTGCSSALDDSELSIPVGTDGGTADGAVADAGVGDGGGGVDGGGTGDGGVDGGSDRTDPGGVPDPKGASGQGCCNTAAGGAPAQLFWILLGLLALRARRRI